MLLHYNLKLLEERYISDKKDKEIKLRDLNEKLHEISNRINLLTSRQDELIEKIQQIKKYISSIGYELLMSCIKLSLSKQFL